MEFNLKNRPRHHLYQSDEKETIIIAYEEFLDWFEGFEKELQEKWDLCRTKDDLDHLIKEILGEP